VRFNDTNAAGGGENEAAEYHPANPSRKESCWNCYKLFSMADVQAKTDPVTHKVRKQKIIDFGRIFVQMPVCKSICQRIRSYANSKIKVERHALRNS
jgi:hypothetical protein